MEFLRKLFGPSKKEIWQELSRRMGGQFVDGGWLGKDAVVVSHKEWTIVLDNYVVSTGKTTHTYTRIRAPYINKDGFRFTIYRRNFFADVGKFFGMEDVEIGEDEQFDFDFIIKGNDHYKLWKFFANPRIRYLFNEQPRIKVTVKSATPQSPFGSFGKNVDELQFIVHGIIKDIDQLHKLFDLFAEMLDHLCHINSAYEDDPTLKNYYS
ncbi:MAG TPA: hypothetical protein PK239_16700 [Chitinophagales bacterium]|nr:hypothetical protein [Chitinophagales bacterium]